MQWKKAAKILCPEQGEKSGLIPKVILGLSHDQLLSHLHAHVLHICKDIIVENQNSGAYMVAVSVVEAVRMNALTGYLRKFSPAAVGP